MTTDDDKIATVAYASAVTMLNELWAGADADQKTELLLRLLPYFEGCAMAVLDCKANWKPVFQPSRN